MLFACFIKNDMDRFDDIYFNKKSRSLIKEASSSYLKKGYEKQLTEYIISRLANLVKK